MSERAGRFVGLDFGTTNTTVAVADERGRARALTFGPAALPTFRSVIYHDAAEAQDGGPAVRVGPDALAAYRAASHPGRLIQSLKTFLSDLDLRETALDGRAYAIEELVARIVRGALEAAGIALEPGVDVVVAGRPVRFAGSKGPGNDAAAEARLRRALALAGVTDAELVPEPVAAASAYQATLRCEELALIVDVGGGTTDFSVLRLPPAEAPGEPEVLGCGGVGVAGDAFDARLVERVVAPRLGAGSRYRSSLGKWLPAPRWIFGHLQQWHLVAALSAPENVRVLREVAATSDEPERLAALLEVATNNRGFQLHEAVQATKDGLSVAERAPFAWRVAGHAIERTVPRRRFVEWIGPELAAVEAALEETLAAASCDPAAIDAVFLTGGSSQVPAVRAIAARRLGEGRLRSGEVLTSVASGLARIAARRAGRA